MSTKTKKPAKAIPGFNLYRDAQKKWRWRLVSTNGRTIADSGEGYTRRKDCLKGACAVVSTRIYAGGNLALHSMICATPLRTAPVVDLTKGAK